MVIQINIVSLIDIPDSTNKTVLSRENHPHLFPTLTIVSLNLLHDVQCAHKFFLHNALFTLYIDLLPGIIQFIIV